MAPIKNRDRSLLMKSAPPGPVFRILSDDQIGLIHEKTLAILEEIGVRVRHKEAVGILTEAGAKGGGDSVVRIPSTLVERVLQTSPKSIEVYDRSGNLSMVLDGGQTYYGAPSDSFYILDHEIGRRRPFLLNDIEKIAKVVDFLPNLDFIHSAGLLPKEKPEMATRLAFSECFKNTGKPICFLANEADSCRDIINLSVRVSGGEENFRARPFILHYSEPISPLLHSEEGIDKVLLCADSHVPLVYMPYCLMGGTAPVTMAGALVQCNAEVLSGLVIQQLRSPGAPFIYGTMPAPIDMRTTTGLYGAPELHLAIAASREIARHYGLPFFGTAGTSDSKHLDYQSVMEGVMSCMLTGFNGPDLAHDVGFLDHSNIISPELIVLTNEVIDMVRPLTQGIAVTEETLAIEVIRKVALRKKSFIEEDHTYEHFREFWYPELLDRSMEGETPELGAKVKEKLKTILRDHQVEPPGKEALKELKNLTS
jgi:trimethylamine--corrinoid protein Co-methyltransferase